MKHIIGGTLILFCMMVVACTKDTNTTNTGVTKYTDAADCSGVSPTYNGSIATLINSNCSSSGCHNATSRKGGIQLDTYSTAKDNFSTGSALCTINWDCQKMPDGRGKMAAADIKSLTCWVKNGCPQ